MVDERAMSIITWLNAPRQKQQVVSTVSNHLAIQNFNRMDTSVSRVYAYLDSISLSHITSNQQDKQKEPVTINWCNIKADIKHPPMSAKKPREDGNIAEDDKSSDTNPINPENGLDNSLLDLSGSQHTYFDLETQFNISCCSGTQMKCNW